MLRLAERGYSAPPSRSCPSSATIHRAYSRLITSLTVTAVRSDGSPSSTRSLAQGRLAAHGAEAQSRDSRDSRDYSQLSNRTPPSPEGITEWPSGESPDERTGLEGVNPVNRVNEAGEASTVRPRPAPLSGDAPPAFTVVLGGRAPR